MRKQPDVDVEQMKNPSAEYRLFPIGHGLSSAKNDGGREALIRDWVKARGSGGAVINVPWESGWTQNSQNIDRLLDTAQQLKNQGLRTWLYDEYFYPSGWGCGLAIPNPPENQSKNIAYQYVMTRQGEQVELYLPEGALQYIWAAFYPVSRTKLDYQHMVSVPFKSRQISAKAPGNGYCLFAFYIRPSNVSHADQMKPEDLPGGPRKYLDFLDADAVRQFIEVALVPAANQTENFGDTFDAIFTDEPALMTTYCTGTQGIPYFDSVPYSPELFREIEHTYGYSLYSYLPALFTGNDRFSKRRYADAS